MRARAFAPVSPWCSFRLSAICFSIVCSGFSDVIGSWKMKLMSLPRTSRSVFFEAPTISVPSKVTEPSTSAESGNSETVESAVSDLPDPDSPTSPSVSPGAISSETFLTASTVPSSVRKVIERSRICRSGVT